MDLVAKVLQRKTAQVRDAWLGGVARVAFTVIWEVLLSKLSVVVVRSHCLLCIDEQAATTTVCGC